MTIIKNTILLIAFLFSGLTAFAQVGIDEYTWEEYLEKAYALLEESSYYNAVDYIQKVVEAQPDELRYVLLMADTYNRARGYNLAAQYYGQLLEIPGSDSILQYPQLRYHYAEMLKQDGQCREAIEQFNIFIQGYEGEDLGIFQETVETHIAGCELFLAGPKETDYKLDESVDFLTNTINGAYTEFAPLPAYNNYLIFSSLRADEYIATDKDKTKSKIYTARKEEGVWVYQEELAGPFNLDTEHTGHGSYSKDGQRFYFTRCPSEDNNLVKCRIYVSSMVDAEWAEPVMLGLEVNAEEGETTTPVVVDYLNQEYIYFTSDRDDGFGGTDIWYTIRTGENTYREATNLGGRINTEFNETTPYFDVEENILYYSSNGLPGFGGYDVFSAVLDGNTYRAPVNMGHTINSGADDMYFILTENRDEGFMVSNRAGAYGVDNPTCCDDIYNFVPKKPAPPVVTIKGTLCDYDSYDKAPLTGIKVDLYEQLPNGKEELVASQVSKPGYVFENLPVDKRYVLVVEQAGYIPVAKPVNTIGIEEDTKITQDICVSKTGLQVNGIVYSDDGKSVEILPGAEVTLYEITPEGKLRKVQSVISGADGSYSFFLPADKNFRIISKKEGYLNTSTEDISTVGLTDQTRISRDIYMKLNKKGMTFQLKNIYYDYDKATLRSESITELNKLLRLLYDNPTLKIELGSHTDSRGGTSYNQLLSERRAKSVVDYLVENNIPETRLVPKGYGELNPIAPNDNPDGSDNPAGRQLNRRTEFTILGKVTSLPPELEVPYEEGGN